MEGDLKGAIDQYKKLAQGSNRAIAAQALIHMGECHEKLGSKEARAQYELVISKFADQKDAVAQARARMTAIQTAPKGPTLTQVCSWDCWNRISPDGRWTLYQRTDGIAIRDNDSGGSMRLLVDGAVCSMQFSPDNTRVAYATRNPRQTFVVNVDGSAKTYDRCLGGPDGVVDRRIACPDGSAPKKSRAAFLGARGRRHGSTAPYCAAKPGQRYRLTGRALDRF